MKKLKVNFFLTTPSVLRKAAAAMLCGMMVGLFMGSVSVSAGPCDTGLLQVGPITISVNTIWNTPLHAIGTITIPSGITLTINAKDFAKVEVYNTIGQLIEIKTVNTFDVSPCNAGIYFFKVYDINNNIVVKRVMVAK